MIYVMSGGGISDAYAAISVTYPAGSICTCTNGTKTLTAKDTSGRWLFLLPSGGNWTVKCVTTDNTKSKEKTITVTEKFSYSVTLSYAYYLFQSGTGLASGISVKPFFSAYGYNITTNAITWSTSVYVGNQLSILPAINLSEYNTLHIELKCNGRFDGDRTVTVGVGSDHASGQSTPGNFVAKVNNIYNETRNVYTVDISTVTATLFIKLAAFAVTGEIYSIWLE